ncbi:MAG: isoprenylcysteine carboxylmethyltransferase family protein [Burkholderiaceae bacterium]
MSLETRIPPPVVALAAALLTWGIAQMAPRVELPMAMRVALSLVLLVVGIGITASGIRTFRRARTTIDPRQPQMASSLVRSGIYRITRNPMYLGILFVLVGWAVLLSSAWALLGALAFMAYIGRFQIVPEERALSSLFGTDYAAYKTIVRRWL